MIGVIIKKIDANAVKDGVGGNMKILLTAFIIVKFATVVQAAEPKITETADGVVVEYSGTPADKTSAEEKKLQKDFDAAETSQLTDKDQNTAAGTGQPKEEQPVRYQSYREEKKSKVRELKKLRMSSPSGANPQ